MYASKPNKLERSRRLDLTDALTSLEWSDKQVDALGGDLAKLSDTGAYEISQEASPEGLTIVYVEAKKSATKLFAPAVNAILQAQRSSLDYLAVALAVAHGHDDPKDTYFPIVKSAEALQHPQTLKKLRRLHPKDQAAILATKPYPGGNDALYILHLLNIERKHRRLGLMAQLPAFQGFGGTGSGGRIGMMQTFGHVLLPTSGRKPLAVIDLEGEIYIEIGVDITFCDVPYPNANPEVLTSLRLFGGVCRQVIEAFSE